VAPVRYIPTTYTLVWLSNEKALSRNRFTTYSCSSCHSSCRQWFKTTSFSSLRNETD